jgi:hypothetical protein
MGVVSRALMEGQRRRRLQLSSRVLRHRHCHIILALVRLTLDRMTTMMMIATPVVAIVNAAVAAL